MNFWSSKNYAKIKQKKNSNNIKIATLIHLYNQKFLKILIIMIKELLKKTVLMIL